MPPALSRPPEGPLRLSGPVLVAARLDDRELWRLALPHGVDPRAVIERALDRGVAERALDRGVAEPALDPATPLGLPDARREPGGELLLTYAVASECAAPDVDPLVGAEPLWRGPHLVVAPGEAAIAVQRVAASVLVWARGALLATQYSHVTSTPGAWALPGGGVDPLEDPRAAARRECWEESGQHVEVGPLVRVASRHWLGRSPAGRLEDFHGLSLVYEGRCPAPTAPVVHDVDGSTAHAAWVPAADVPRLGWSPAQREIVLAGPPGE